MGGAMAVRYSIHVYNVHRAKLALSVDEHCVRARAVL